ERDSLIDLLYFRVDRSTSCLLVGLELLILRTLLDLRLALSGVRFDTVEILRVSTDKLALHSFPRTLAKRFVIERPGDRDRQQQRRHHHPTAGRATGDRIRSRQIGFPFDQRLTRL